MSTRRGFRPKLARPVFALSVSVVAMLAACFWPFEFHPHNGVTWLREQSGLRFSGKGLAMSSDRFPAMQQPSGDGSLTIEIAIRPLKLDGSRVPHILSFVSDAGLPVFVVGTWKSALMVQVGRFEAEQGLRKPSWIWLGDALALERTLFVSVVARPQGTSLYLDGRPRGHYQNARLPGGAYPLGRLLLGNSPTGRNGWKGDILAVAVYKRALTADEIAQHHGARASGGLPELSGQEALLARYDFAEGSGAAAGSRYGHRIDMLIPPVFKPLRRIVLAPPPQGATLKQLFNRDGVLNVLGFMPFGIFAMAAIAGAPRLSDRRRSLIVVGSGLAFSLAIELTQVYLPARSSSLTDLCANTIGTAMGVLLFFAFSRRCASPGRAGSG